MSLAYENGGGALYNPDPNFSPSVAFPRSTPKSFFHFMHPSKETLNSPSSRVDADSTSRRRILRCIFSGVGES